MKAMNALSIAAALWSVALAADFSVTVTRPALAGYCVESLRNEISQVQQAVSSCGPPLTSQECDEVTKRFARLLPTNSAPSIHGESMHSAWDRTVLPSFFAGPRRLAQT